MSALPNQSYANLNQSYWLKASGNTPSGQSVTELSVIGVGSTIEERLLTTPSNAQIQINTLVGNTRTFKMGLFAVPDLVNPVPVNNQLLFDLGNALPVMSLTQSNVIVRQPIVLDTLANVTSLYIQQSSTASILSNGNSFISLSNSGVIQMSLSTMISNGTQCNFTSSSNIVFSNASGRTAIESSGGSMIFSGLCNSFSVTCNYITIDPNGFAGVKFNENTNVGWNPDVAKTVVMRGIIDSENSNFGAFIIDLSNTSNFSYKIPFGAGANYVFAQDVFKVLTQGNSNLCNQLRNNSMSMVNMVMNRWNNYFLDSNTGQTYFQVGTPSPSNLINAIVISNNGVVGFPAGVDITTFVNASNSSNSIGGVTLSNGTCDATTLSTGSQGVTITGNNINATTTFPPLSPYAQLNVEGVTMKNGGISGALGCVFGGGFSSFNETVTIGAGGSYTSPYSMDIGMYAVFINQRYYQNTNQVGFYILGIWTEQQGGTPSHYNYSIQLIFQNQVSITFNGMGGTSPAPTMNINNGLGSSTDIFYTITKIA